MVHAAPLVETLAFLLPNLPARPGPLLEAGCGDGALAAALQSEGWTVAAIDREPEAVAAALGRGVRAECVDFKDYSGGPFAALLFTRSLHHIHPLDETLRHVHDLLRPGGLLLLEEFALEAVDAPAAEWFFLRWDAARRAGNKAPHRHDPGPSSPPLARWRGLLAHDPPLHEGAALRAGVAARFETLLDETAPYLFRYFAEWATGVDWTARLLDEERTLLAAGRIKPVGLRIVARR